MTAIRDHYRDKTVDGYYKSVTDYSNPHKCDIKKIISDIPYMYKQGSLLDLCCGNGLITECLIDRDIIGCDPYLYQQYVYMTNKFCLTYDFKDIVQGKLTDKFNVIYCSFALHLCDKSMLHNLLYQLKRICNYLIVISPTDNIADNINFDLICHTKENRTHCFIYRG